MWSRANVGSDSLFIKRSPPSSLQPAACPRRCVRVAAQAEITTKKEYGVRLYVALNAAKGAHCLEAIEEVKRMLSQVLIPVWLFAACAPEIVAHCGWTMVPRDSPQQQRHSDLVGAGTVPRRGKPRRGLGYNLFTKRDPVAKVTTLLADGERKGILFGGENADWGEGAPPAPPALPEVIEEGDGLRRTAARRCSGAAPAGALCGGWSGVAVRTPDATAVVFDMDLIHHAGWR
eukprot:gene5201-9314_t